MSADRSRLPAFQVSETRPVFVKVEFDSAGRPVAVLGNVNFRNVPALRINVLLVHRFTIDKDDDVGILFDGSGFAQVRQFRNRRRSGFYRTRKLGQGKNRDVEFPRKAFQRPMDEGIKILNAVQDVYLDSSFTVA